MISKIPGQIARPANIPERKDPPNLPCILRHLPENPRRQHLQSRRHHGVQQTIHRFIVHMLRAGIIRLNIPLLIRCQQRQREVVVDMCVHPCQCKLNPIDPPGKTCAQHRTPGARYRRRPGQKPSHRPEIKPCKDDIQRQQPVRIFPPTSRRHQVDLPSHHQVEPIEPLQPVPIRQKLVNTLHRLQHLFDRRGHSSTHQQVESLIRGCNRHRALPSSILRDGRSIAQRIETPTTPLPTFIRQTLRPAANNFA